MMANLAITAVVRVSSQECSAVLFSGYLNTFLWIHTQVERAHGSTKMVPGHSPAAEAKASSSPFPRCQCCSSYCLCVLLFFPLRMLSCQTFAPEFVTEGHQGLTYLTWTTAIDLSFLCSLTHNILNKSLKIILEAQPCLCLQIQATLALS